MRKRERETENENEIRNVNNGRTQMKSDLMKEWRSDKVTLLFQVKSIEAHNGLISTKRERERERE